MITALLNRYAVNNIKLLHRTLLKTHTSLRVLSTTPVWHKSVSATQSEDDDHKPIKLSSTAAYKYSSLDTFTPEEYHGPRGQLEIICLSITILVIYCYFREENSVDELLSKSLYDTFPEMEVINIKASMEQAEKAGLDTTPYVERLRELGYNDTGTAAQQS